MPLGRLISVAGGKVVMPIAKDMCHQLPHPADYRGGYYELGPE